MMNTCRSLHFIKTQCRLSRRIGHRLVLGRPWIHSTTCLRAVKPVVLADIGEGIVECEVIQWFVEPGARVEEFSRLCEVQSDKASVEITSRFSGVVKKLYYETGAMAKVGKPFVDIDIQGEPRGADLNALMMADEPPPVDSAGEARPQVPAPVSREQGLEREPEHKPEQGLEPGLEQSMPASQSAGKGKHAGLATPAVRHLSKELNVHIRSINGTGKDGRVLKEDIHKFVQARDAASGASGKALQNSAAGAADSEQETVVQMTPTQVHMFKTMTRSLSIPHFLYADEIDFSSLYDLRARLNKVLSRAADTSPGQVSKLTYLPFIIKAVSMALHRHPILNARVDVDSDTQKPTVILRSQHNIGVAVDTPSGLVVPVIRNVAALTILDIAAEVGRLQGLAVDGKLSPRDVSGGTITVSNIGGIGGTYLSPVIVEREVAILGVGRMRVVPAFADDGEDGDGDGGLNRVIRKRVCNFSWSADHRIVDGATMARAAEVVRRVLEEPDVMVMHLR